MTTVAHHHHLAAATVLVFVAFTMAPLAAGDPVGQLCGTSGNYTLNSTYQGNIRRLAATLPKNASTSATLFATDTFGAVPDIVYALALCRGDTNASACSGCVAAAFLDAQQLCAYNKDATMFYDPCLLRYSNQNFLADPSSDGRGTALILMNTQNVTARFKVFDAAVAALLNATAAYAAANSSKRFGTGVEAFQNFDSNRPRIYGLAQCTPDMTPADCQSCLSGIIQTGPKYFSGKQGGRILSVRCNYRYEQYPFFTSTPLLQLAEPTVGAPAPAPAVVNGTPTPPTTGGARRDTTNPEDIQSIDSLIIDVSTLRAATENFAEANKLGEGGFGSVYKGILPDDQEIAVKRLSQTSRQGMEELKNELVLVAKLQHKNLVRLVGVCLEDHEKLLVYEYMPNKSLDTILFSTVWEHWTTGTLVEIMDPSLSSLAPRDLMLKCIHIGLLCVQDDHEDRPMMSTVNVMLSSSTVTLQAPSRPAFCFPKSGFNSEINSEVYPPGAYQSASRSPMSLNDVSITELEPR
ncbi:Cysteine-rich receptor-like protein kinase 10 [Zea mays]|uniref:Cysteine-rich receptor-like protein kinase 10 n=1 Tax=Zea mays TaxID=4577 RepID=A0A3L6DVT7_MAIZE|nr:Cysteine-rich receptor-like protein kinase 10 [Zea mays]